MKPPLNDPALPDEHNRHRRRIFAISWLSYFSYYFARKNWSVVKNKVAEEGDLSVDQLAFIDTFYLTLYMVGQFVNGVLADIIGPRRLIGAGMIVSATLAVIFSVSEVYAIFAITYGLNGLAQSTGWPANGRLMASWFSVRERGEVMGFWGTCYQLGGAAATSFASTLLPISWRVAYVAPALWAGVVGVGVLLWVRDRPSDHGFEDPDVAKVDRAERRRLRREAWPRVLKTPQIWFMGANYFCMKLTRYSLLFWLPYYLATAQGYDDATAGWMSTSFEIGGVIGVIGAGLMADRLFGRRRVAVAVCMTAGLALALGLYAEVAAAGPVPNFLAMMLVGALLFGPDSLVSGVVAQDLGGPYAAALACGMVNGLGSIGAILQGPMISYVSDNYGWDALFLVFQLLAVLATLSLLPFFAVRPTVRD